MTSEAVVAGAATGRAGALRVRAPSSLLPVWARCWARWRSGLLLVAPTGVPRARRAGGVLGRGGRLVVTPGRLGHAAACRWRWSASASSWRNARTSPTSAAKGRSASGGIFATAASLSWGAARLPGPLAYLFPLLVGTLAGALWGGLAGLLKARRGSNEVITTLLLTFIARAARVRRGAVGAPAAAADDRLVDAARVAGAPGAHAAAGADGRLGPAAARRHRHRDSAVAAGARRAAGAAAPSASSCGRWG